MLSSKRTNSVNIMESQGAGQAAGSLRCWELKWTWNSIGLNGCNSVLGGSSIEWKVHCDWWLVIGGSSFVMDVRHQLIRNSYKKYY